MTSQSDFDQPQHGAPGWLMPAVIGGVLVLAAIVAVVLTSRPTTPQAPAQRAVESAPTAAVAEAQPPAAEHGSLDPDGPAVEVIGLADARARFDAGSALFIDVRSGSDYAAGRLPGALTITSPELEQRLANLPPETVVIAYGDAARPDSGQRGAQIFMQLGYPAVSALEGGFQAWRDAGYPVEP